MTGKNEAWKYMVMGTPLVYNPKGMMVLKVVNEPEPKWYEKITNSVKKFFKKIWLKITN